MVCKVTQCLLLISFKIPCVSEPGDGSLSPVECIFADHQPVLGPHVGGWRRARLSPGHHGQHSARGRQPLPHLGLQLLFFRQTRGHEECGEQEICVEHQEEGVSEFRSV